MCLRYICRKWLELVVIFRRFLVELLTHVSSVLPIYTWLFIFRTVSELYLQVLLDQLVRAVRSVRLLLGFQSNLQLNSTLLASVICTHTFSMRTTMHIIFNNYNYCPPKHRINIKQIEWFLKQILFATIWIIFDLALFAYTYTGKPNKTPAFIHSFIHSTSLVYICTRLSCS